MARRLLAVAALFLGGCNWYYNTLPSPDQLLEAIPWFDHMIKSRAVSPYARRDIPRTTVPGTVPITGSEVNDSADFKSGNVARADRLVNPTDFAGTLARGDTLYQTFCSVCHGAAGAADGPVTSRMGALSLLTDKAKAYTDGYLYSIIRYGRGVMPRYGDKIYRPMDRWAVVNYVRMLQGKPGAAAATPGPAGAARPGGR